MKRLWPRFADILLLTHLLAQRITFLLRKLLSLLTWCQHMGLLLQCGTQRRSPLLALGRNVGNLLSCSLSLALVLYMHLRHSLHGQGA